MPATRGARTAPTAARKAAAARGARAAAPVGGTDLDAVQSTAVDAAHPFKLGGVWYHLLPLQHLDYRIVEMADTGDASAVRVALQAGLIEKDEWPTIDAAALSIAQLDRLFRDWLSASGLAPGDSEASSQSFAPTAKR